MAGATAGTAILRVPNEKTEDLKVVTLTVNNSCNFECPHCYLQYNGERRTLSEEDADKVLSANYDLLSIVGKEPTLSPKSLEKLVRVNSENGRKTSMITNGSRILTLPSEILTSLDYVDVSFDGGPKTYSQRRNAEFNAIVANISKAQKLGVRSVSALHTLYAENIRNLEDMMQVDNFMDLDKIAFSVYKVPHNHGAVRVTSDSLSGKILPTLADSKSFMENPKAILLLTDADFVQGEPDKVLEIANSLGLKNKIHYTPDPLRTGFVRVTYEGKVLAPHDATHPLLYASSGYSLQDKRFEDLNEIFRQLQDDKTHQEIVLR